MYTFTNNAFVNFGIYIQSYIYIYKHYLLLLNTTMIG